MMTHTKRRLLRGEPGGPWRRWRARPSAQRGLPPLAVLLAACLLASCLSAGARAQALNLDFPVAGAGFDQQLGVTVRTRPRPLYDEQGIQVGAVEIRPSITQLTGYESNPTASATASGSAVSRTSADLQVGTLAPDENLAATAGLDHLHYFSVAGADYTDWNVGLRGTALVAGGPLVGAYSHATFHQLGATLGTVRSQTPVADTTDTGQLLYTFTSYNLELTPDISASAYRFGTAGVQGVQLSQSYLNRDVVAGGLTARYALNDVGGVVASVRGVDTHYLSRLQGQPGNSSKSVLLLSGLDYQSEGLFRYRLLGGLEIRLFDDRQVPDRAAPIVEADVTWTPTGLTTVSGTVSRTIDDPQAAGVNGFTLTQGSLTVDHELLRNVLLQGRASAQYGHFFGGGSQTGYSLGAGVDYLVNRNVSASATYDFHRLSGTSGSTSGASLNAVDSAGFSDNVFGLVVRVRL